MLSSWNIQSLRWSPICLSPTSICLLIIFNSYSKMSVVMYSFLTVHSWRFLPTWGEAPLLFVSWWLWFPLGFLFQLFLDKWCHGPVCSWCMSGRSRCSFFYLEVSSIWFINGERQQHLKQDPSLLMWNLLIMTVEKVSWIDVYQFVVHNVLPIHEMFSMLDFRF